MNKKILIIGGDSNNFTKKQIVEKIFDHVPAGNVTFTDKTQDARNYKVDFSKISKLKIKNKFNLRKGIDEIIFDLKKNTNHQKFKKIFSNI